MLAKNAWMQLNSYYQLQTYNFTSPEYALLSTVCSDPLEASQPKWKWSCWSLYTLLPPQGPPLSRAEPLDLSIVKVGACPLLTRVPVTLPFELSGIKRNPRRYEFRTTLLLSMLMGDWVFSIQWCETFFQSFGPKIVDPCSSTAKVRNFRFFPVGS